MLKEQLYQNIEKAISEMNFSAAETLAADALRNFPEESFGYKFLAVALPQRENVPFEAVEMCYVKLIQLNAHDTDSILKYAELKLQQGEQEAAIKAYIEVLTNDIANVSALKALGEYELYSNNFPQQALVYFDAAVANAPQDNDLRCHRAIAFKNSGRTIDALMELNSVINKGYNELAYSTKAKMLGEMQKFEDTLPLLTELAKNAPENFAYAYNLGKNAAQIQDYNLATIEEGIFGINIHRSNPAQASVVNEKWSAGCQVFSSPKDFDEFMAIIDEASRLWGDKFTYTLLEEKDFNV